MQETKNKNLEQLLEDKRFQGIAGLYSWSTNYEYPTPFTYFLDIVGISQDTYGESLADWSNSRDKLFALEIDYLADALKEYARGEDAHLYTLDLVVAEMEKENN